MYEVKINWINYRIWRGTFSKNRAFTGAEHIDLQIEDTTILQYLKSVSKGTKMFKLLNKLYPNTWHQAERKELRSCLLKALSLTKQSIKGNNTVNIFFSYLYNHIPRSPLTIHIKALRMSTPFPSLGAGNFCLCTVPDSRQPVSMPFTGFRPRIDALQSN